MHLCLAWRGWQFFGVSNGLIGKAPFLGIKCVLKTIFVKIRNNKKAPKCGGFYL